MNQSDYLDRVIRLYLDAPDTPEKARRNDWAVAGSFYQRRIPIAIITHAVQLTVLRRHLRDPTQPSLEPIHSLAYYRPLIDHLLQVPPDAGYVDYVAFRCRLLLRTRTPATPKKRG